MAKLIFLCSKVSAGMLARSRPAGNPLHDANARSLELRYFIRVVGQEADIAQAKRLQSFGREFVVACIICKSEAAICFHGIKTPLLQLVGFQLIDQSDSPALLWQVEEYS